MLWEWYTDAFLNINVSSVHTNGIRPTFTACSPTVFTTMKTVFTIALTINIITGCILMSICYITVAC